MEQISNSISNAVKNGELPNQHGISQSIDPARSTSPYSPGMCVPGCPICGGLGFYRMDVDRSHPLFGKLHVCPNKPFFLQEPSAYGLEPPEMRLTWDQVRDVANIREAVSAVRNALATGRGWVYIWGPPGLGKTLVLKIAVAEALRMKRPACYVRFAEIMDNLRQAYSPKYGDEESEKRLERWARLPLLSIDEIDKIRETEFVQERRFVLLDRRYEASLSGHSITLIASNTHPSFLEPYLASRIQDGRNAVVHVDGDDNRPAMWWQEK